MFGALVEDLADATPPCLNHACEIDTRRDRRVVGTRGMLSKQFFQSPFLGERPDVCDIEFVIRNADLNGNETGVVFVDKGIENQFAQRLARERKLLHAMHTVLIPDFGFEVLEENEVERLFGLFDQGPVNIVMVKKVGFIFAEFSKLDVCSGNPLLRLFREKERGGV